ncbi:MAG TPA: LysE family translocator [Pseudoxanthomonas sp.]|mgnify:CR=1 FL=1|nr:LysE family translocator [Pseudoxanthomonas sp.]
MDTAPILAMGTFALGMSISPGPANMVIVASGANHGFRRTLPFVSGATVGFTLLLAFVGFWLLQAVGGHPALLHWLGIAGAAFVAWVGWRIAASRPGPPGAVAGAPGFAQGFLLQWLNPKAWVACASGAALFSDPRTHAALALFMAIYFVVCYLSLAAWALLGDRASALLDSPRRMRLFNVAMGGLLVATAAYMLWLQLFPSPARAG